MRCGAGRNPLGGARCRRAVHAMIRPETPDKTTSMQHAQMAGPAAPAPAPRPRPPGTCTARRRRELGVCVLLPPLLCVHKLPAGRPHYPIPSRDALDSDFG